MFQGWPDAVVSWRSSLVFALGRSLNFVASEQSTALSLRAIAPTSGTVLDSF